MRRIATLSALWLLLTACGGPPVPDVGDACNQGDGYCVDGQTSRVCVDGAIAEFPCRGPDGCSFDGVCDQRIVEAGDPCMPDTPDGAEACLDGRGRTAACHQGEWTDALSLTRTCHTGGSRLCTTDEYYSCATGSGCVCDESAGVCAVTGAGLSCG